MRLRFSALQRAEIAEMRHLDFPRAELECFSALQRAEIAEITPTSFAATRDGEVSVLFNEPKLLKSKTQKKLARCGLVSVLFNEPKLLKWRCRKPTRRRCWSFSALQRAEIAEIGGAQNTGSPDGEFQCSSTSRNC